VRFRVTTVEAVFTPDGWPVPRSVMWGGEQLTVVDTGRRWRTDDGIHVLALVSDGRVFELHTNGSLWRAALVSRPPRFA
jgi:hypothetical protein